MALLCWGCASHVFVVVVFVCLVCRYHPDEPLKEDMRPSEVGTIIHLYGLRKSTTSDRVFDAMGMVARQRDYRCVSPIGDDGQHVPSVRRPFTVRPHVTLRVHRLHFAKCHIGFATIPLQPAWVYWIVSTK